MRGATCYLAGISKGRQCISIHAPHARSDDGGTFAFVRRVHFNPRSSCEERQRSRRRARSSADFNPRSSCEERPASKTSETNAKTSISIHAPHARSDHMVSTQEITLSDFNPRSSCEERLGVGRWSALQDSFQSTLLMRGATNLNNGNRLVSTYFNPRSSCEERH